MPEKGFSVNEVTFVRKGITLLDDLLHLAVAVFLFFAAVMVLVNAAPGFLHAGNQGILHLLNDVLLVLIILELLWPVLKFLRRAPFSLDPFFYVGIMSSTRRILFIEAEHSMTTKVVEGTQISWQVPLDLTINVIVILVLAIALRITQSTNKKEVEH